MAARKRHAGKASGAPASGSRRGSSSKSSARKPERPPPAEEPAPRRTSRDMERLRHEAARQLLRKLPKKLYCEGAGRSHFVVDKAADRYGLPLRGESIDLFAALKAFHDLLANHGGSIFASMKGGEDGARLELERQRAAVRNMERRSELLDQKLRERRAAFVARGEVVAAFEWIAAGIQAAGELLGRRCGPEAQEILNDCLDRLRNDLREQFSKRARRRAAGGEK